MKTKNDFFKWELSSRDCIDLKKIYIDVADGDLVSGVLLSQIIFWHLPNQETGKTKLRVEHYGKKWLAKGRTDWYKECRISAKQFDRAKDKLKKLGIIKTIVKKFDGNPMIHIRIDYSVLIKKLNEISEDKYSGMHDEESLIADIEDKINLLLTEGKDLSSELKAIFYIITKSKRHTKKIVELADVAKYKVETSPHYSSTCISCQKTIIVNKENISKLIKELNKKISRYHCQVVDWIAQENDLT